MLGYQRFLRKMELAYRVGNSVSQALNVFTYATRGMTACEKSAAQKQHKKKFYGGFHHPCPQEMDATTTLLRLITLLDA